MLNKKQLLLLNCACLFIYVLGAYMGQSFSLPPHGATPIYPPAGIALALLLLYRNVVLPSIFLGALIVQSYLFFGNNSTESIINSLLLGSFISIAVCLQAMLGSYFIRRFVGENNPLIKDTHIIKFLFLGTVTATAISPIFKTIVLFYSDEINISELFSSWVTGWISNAIGVFIITPLALIFLAQPRELWRKRRNYIVYPLLMLLSLVALIFHYSHKQETLRIKTLFYNHSDVLHDELSDELKEHLTINLILKSFFDNSDNVNKTEFQQFSKTLLKHHHSIKSITWISAIKATQRLNFESLLQKPICELDNSQKIVVAKEHRQYFPITYIASIKNNQKFLGFDISSNSTVLKNLLLARDSGKTVVTGKLALIHDKGLLQSTSVFSPIYQKGSLINSIENRRAALKGFVSNDFHLDAEITEIIKRNPNLQLFVEIKEGKTVIYSNVLENNVDKILPSFLHRQNALIFANRHWQIDYRPSSEFMQTQQTWNQWWLLLSCFLFTGLTLAVLLMLTGRTLRTEELVKLRTQALRKEITEREKRNNILHAIASPMMLNDILSLIIEIIENDNPNISCAIMLADTQVKHLQQTITKRLPKSFAKAISGIKIAEGVISCGTAAYLKQRVIVTDISQHPYWVNFIEVAKKANLSSCCSEPILSAEQEILGTLAIYYPNSKYPSKNTLEAITNLAQLSSLAIEKKSSDERIRYLAFYDALTKLPNRRLLYDRLTQELARVERHHNYGGLMFLDLDHFKTLNDSLGHHIGDELLIQVAERLKDCVRDEDTVARLGGDEFVVLLRTKDLDSSLEQVSAYALTIAKRIQTTLYIPYSLQGYEHVVTSSIGITMFGKDNKDIDTLFKQADTAMYEAKNKGRNTFSFYSEDMAHQADKRLQLESDLRKALKNSQFVLYYQPQHNAQGNIVGAEALLRWNHPQKGMIPLSEFMPTCEESGLILAIGEWILRAICQQLIKWSQLVHISLNISSRQFHQPKFTTQIEDILAEYKLTPQRLMLEVTEKIIAKDMPASIEKLNILQALGVWVSIDDFGMGYSSLADLRHLPINQVKIDQSFIRDICTDKDVALIVEAMLMVTNHLGLDVVAEGVETLEQLQFLQQNKNCNIYQGYYFSKPLPESEFSLLLARAFKTL